MGNGTRRIRLIGISSVITLAGCASTSITSMVAPEIQGRQFHHVLVVFPVSDLGERKVAETHFREVYFLDSTTFIPSYEVFFPGRQYSKDEMSALLQQHHIDAALVISLQDAGSRTVHTPTHTTAQCTIWTSNQGCVQASSTTTGGYDLSKPWASFSAVLIDASNTQVVWTASARTGGNAFADAHTLLRSLAEKTVGQLRADGIVP